MIRGGFDAYTFLVGMTFVGWLGVVASFALVAFLHWLLMGQVRLHRHR